MLHLSSRTLLSKNYFPIWTALLESLASSEQINDFAEYQHHERFEMQICTTICKLITLMTSDDLSTLHEILIKYYDTCGLCFEKFLKSVLPDQLELLLEASTHIQHMNMTTAYYLTPDKKSALNLFNDLLQLTHWIKFQKSRVSPLSTASLTRLRNMDIFLKPNLNILVWPNVMWKVLDGTNAHPMSRIPRSRADPISR